MLSEQQQELLMFPEGFEAWLNSKPPEAPVGETEHGDRCPLANYYGEVLFDPNVYSAIVTQEEISGRLLDGEWMRVTPRPWASIFVRRIDYVHGRKGYVTASEALTELRLARLGYDISDEVWDAQEGEED